MNASISESRSNSKVLDSVKEDRVLNSVVEDDAETLKNNQEVYGPRLYANFKPSKPNVDHVTIV